MTVATNKERIDKLERIVVGNGDPGMDEDVRDIRRDVEGIKKTIVEVQKDMEFLKPVPSDLHHLKTVLFRLAGLDAMGMPLKKEGGWWETKFKENIAPDLIKMAIIIIISVLFNLTITHWPL